MGEATGAVVPLLKQRNLSCGKHHTQSCCPGVRCVPPDRGTCERASEQAIKFHCLIRSIITESGYHVNCFTGYNLQYGYSHVRHFHDRDINCAIIIRSIPITFGFCSNFESLLCNIACE